MDDACPLSASDPPDERGGVRSMLAAHRIAVVGMTPDPSRAGNYVPEFLRRSGREVVPVTPTHAEVAGLKTYPTLADVPGLIDLVLVFRRPEFCAQIARDAVAVGAKGLWLQSGIRSEEARQIARAAGMSFVQGRCMMVELGRGG